MKKMLLAIMAALTLAGGVAQAGPYDHKSSSTYAAECVFSFSLAWGSCYYASLHEPQIIDEMIEGLIDGTLEYRGWGPDPEYLRSLTDRQVGGVIGFNKCHHGGSHSADYCKTEYIDYYDVPIVPNLAL